MEAIDLTRSDSEEDVRQSKRQRRSSPDDDVQIIEKPGKPTPAATGPEPTLGDGDLLITNATGPVRDTATKFKVCSGKECVTVGRVA